jgi:hypothetical protein
MAFRGISTAEQAARDEIHRKYAAIHGSKASEATGGASPAASPAAAVGTSDAALQRLEAFHSEVISTNWADYLTLVYTGPFWEAEMTRIMAIAQPHLGNKEVAAKMSQIQETMDVLYKCEDIRDHINELMELATRASGLMGTGYAAGEKVENMEEHAQHCAQAYDALLKAHPEYKPKIEQTVGHGLALLRQKHKFNFSSVHRYFF